MPLHTIIPNVEILPRFDRYNNRSIFLPIFLSRTKLTLAVLRSLKVYFDLCQFLYFYKLPDFKAAVQSKY